MEAAQERMTELHPGSAVEVAGSIRAGILDTNRRVSRAGRQRVAGHSNIDYARCGFDHLEW